MRQKRQARQVSRLGNHNKDGRRFRADDLPKCPHHRHEYLFRWLLFLCCLNISFLVVLDSVKAQELTLPSPLPEVQKSDSVKTASTPVADLSITTVPKKTKARHTPPKPTDLDIGDEAPLLTDLYPQKAEKRDRLSCKKKKGRWTKTKGGLVGCIVRGKKEGRWILKEGVFIQGIMHFKDNRAQGTLWGFSLEGKAIELLTYEAGQKHGYHRKWGPGGQLKLSQLYQRDEKHGSSFEWYSKSCIPAHRGSYKKGKKEGAWIAWYPSGAPREKGAYIDGKPQGLWSYYHQEGNKIREGELNAGIEVGRWKEWLHTGQEWRDVTYIEGVRQGSDELACVKEGGTWQVDYKERTESCMRYGYQTIIAQKSYYPSGSLNRRDPFNLKGENTGEVKIYHPTGEILAKGQVSGGRPEGEYVYVTRSGEPMGAASVITQGTGNWTEYHHTGKVKEKGRWLLGLKVDQWSTYYDHGALESKVTYSPEGMREGLYQRFYRDGTPEASGNFINNARQGIWKFYYTNGQLAVEAGFVDSARSGLWREWHWLSSPKVEGEFTNNKPSGSWKEYHNNGVVSAKGGYTQGKKEGVWEENWYSGSKWRNLEYTSGASDDADEAQCSSLTGQWEANLKERRAGCKVCRVSVEAGQEPVKVGIWRWWHPNGELEREGRFEEDHPHGLWNEYNRQGKLTLSGDYDHGKRVGVWKGYFPNGRIQYEGRFDEQGRERGEWRTYHLNGRKESQGVYQQGQRMDLWSWWDRKGSLSQVGLFSLAQESSPQENKEQKTDLVLSTGADNIKSKGVIKNEQDLPRSQRDGLWISWHPECQLRVFGHYEGGKRVGLWRWWRASGEGWRAERYINGKSQGRETSPVALSKSMQTQLKANCQEPFLEISSRQNGFQQLSKTIIHLTQRLDSSESIQGGKESENSKPELPSIEQ